MRFIHLYLIGYFVLVLGACLALWQAGVLAACPRSGSRSRRSSSSASASCSPYLRCSPRRSPASSSSSSARALARVMVMTVPVCAVSLPSVVLARPCAGSRRLQGRRHDHASTSLTFKGVKAVDASEPAERARDQAELEASLGQESILRPVALRRGPEAHPGVLRRPRLSGRARHRLRRQAERQAGRGRRHRHDRRRRAGQGRGGRLRRLRRHPADASRRSRRSACRSRSGSRATASSSCTTHEMALNELKDHGFPYAKVATERRRWRPTARRRR